MIVGPGGTGMNECLLTGTACSLMEIVALPGNVVVPPWWSCRLVKDPENSVLLLIKDAQHGGNAIPTAPLNGQTSMNNGTPPQIAELVRNFLASVPPIRAGPALPSGIRRSDQAGGVVASRSFIRYC